MDNGETLLVSVRAAQADVDRKRAELAAGQAALATERLQFEAEKKEFAALQEKARTCIEASRNTVKLQVRFETFRVPKQCLVVGEETFFSALLGCGDWQPDEDDHYFINRDPKYVRMLLNYLMEGAGDGKLPVDADSLSPADRTLLASDIDFYQITSLAPLFAEAADDTIDMSGAVQWDPPATMRTASSSHPHPETQPSASLLSSEMAWFASSNGPNEWLQMDLGQVSTVVGVVLAGYSCIGVWTTQYTVSISVDGQQFQDLGTTFDGSTDATTLVRRPFPKAYQARFVRIHPQQGNNSTYHGMRAGVLLMQ
eukprot:NODE_127_length_1854_cov_306.356787_g87_i0.p1 GENE.NODE_127_length_1854_cov_306.356787_g87_i0~~NODE_127_length_1854_cov_306.356787_g87_i0.p1  ORF type:complete len:312 (+),score=91.21 NODE_127_length_1854_cov_306.356787_g87_i0:139-1074(+)